MNLRDFILWSREAGTLVEVGRAVDPRFELAQVVAELDGRPVLFKEVAGYPGWQVLSGVCARREHFAKALGCSVPELVERMAAGLAHARNPPVLPTGPCREVTQDKVDLTKLPIPRYHPEDGGPYITSGVAVIRDPDYGLNASYHRLMILDGIRCAARIIEGRGTHTALSKAPGDLPIAIAVGCPVQMLLAAAMSPRPGVSELAVGHALAPTPLVRCRTSDLLVPAEAELVLEGRITHSLVDEGPFPDLTGTMDRVRHQPVIEIDHVTHRFAPVFHALLPGGLEHQNLMGMPREPTIYAAVNEVCRCTGVYVTPGGASWLHAVVQIDKRREEDGRRAIWAAFRGHTSLKHVVVVDADIDLYDPTGVEWAVATRFQASRDLVVLTEQPGSSLDPSATQVPGHKTRTAKMGLDATMPLGGTREGYRRVRYGEVDLAPGGDRHG